MVVAAVAAAAVVLVGGAVAAVHLLRAEDGDRARDPAGFSRSGDDEAGATLVVNNAPDLTAPLASFADGYEEVWSEDLERSMGTFLSGDVAVVSNLTDDGAEPLTRLRGLDVSSGDELWSLDQHNIGCRGVMADGRVACQIFAGENDLNDTIMFIDPRTGDEAARVGADAIGADEWCWTPVIFDAGLLTWHAPDCGFDTPWSASLIDSSGSVLWTTPGVSALMGTDGWGTPTEADGLIAYTASGNRTQIFEAASGAVIEIPEGCETAQVFDGPTVYCTVSEWNESAVAGVSESNGVSVHAIKGWLEDFLDTPRPSDVVLLTQGADPRKLRGLAASTGDQLWEGPVVDGLGAWDGARTLVFGAYGELTAVDLETGEELWASTFTVPPSRGHEDWTEVTFVDPGAVGVRAAESFDLQVFDAKTGDPLWMADLYVDGVSQTEKGTYLLGRSLGEGASGVTLLKAGGGSGDSSRSDPVAPPAGVPPCPDGQEPLLWSQFGQDYVIVCATADGTSFSVAARDGGEDLEPVELTFTAGGCSIEFAGGQVIRLSLGGAHVTRADGGVATASAAWSWDAGEVTFRDAPDPDWLTCPKGSWPIALSSYNGGAVLVCGTALDRPTLLKWTDTDAGEGESDTVSAEAGGWCASAGGTRTCSFAAPALVTYAEDGGAESSQRPVDSNYFSGRGSGGTGQGKGAYNLDVPDDTAEDQLRYLVEVLNASAQNRTDITELLNQVERREVTGATLAGLRAVADSRARLVSGVESAPVSAVPGGPALVAKLSAALAKSEEADRMYVTWAEGVRGGADPLPTSRVWEAAAHESEVLKQEFVQLWNSQIVPEFKVQAFRADQI